MIKSIEKSIALFENYGLRIQNTTKYHNVEIMEIQQKLDKIKSSNLTNLLDGDVFAAVAKFREIINTLDKISDKFKELSPQHGTSDKSFTFIVETSNMYLRMNRKYLHLRKIMEEQMINIIKSANIPIKNITDIDAMRALYHKNPAAIDLYVYLMKQAVQSKDPIFVKNVLKRLDADKTAALDFKPIHSNTYTHNPPFQTHQLIPRTDMQQLQQLLKLISTSNKTVASLSKQYRIFIFNHILTQPSQHLINKLIDYKAAKPFLQGPRSGITQKTIDRMTLIKKYPGKYKWNFSVKAYGTTTNGDLLLETLDGKSYRILTPWSSGNLIVPPSFQNWYREKLPNRAYAWNDLKTRKITKHAFLLKPPADLIMQNDTIEYKFTRYTILTEIMKLFDSTFKMQVINKYKFNEFAYDQQHYDLISDIILEDYVSYSKNKTAQPINQEIIITFMSQINFALSKFSRAVLVAIDNMTEKSTKWPLAKDTARPLMSKIIEYGLSKSINQKTDVYTIMTNKRQLLVAV